MFLQGAFMFQDRFYFMNWFFFSKSFNPHLPLLLSLILYLFKIFFLLIFFFYLKSTILICILPMWTTFSYYSFFLFPHPTYPITIISNLRSITISSSSSSTSINVLYNFDSSIPFSHSSYFPSFVVSPLCHFDMSISPQCPIIHRFLTSSNNHPMVTRSKHGILKPKLYNLSTLITSNFILIEPTTY